MLLEMLAEKKKKMAMKMVTVKALIILVPLFFFEQVLFGLQKCARC